MNNKTILRLITKPIALSLLLITPQLPAQEPARDTLRMLTMEEAVMTALAENPDIIIARNEAEIDRNNATAGNAGLFPSLSLSGGYNREVKDTRIRFAVPDQPDINRDNARSTTYQAAATLSYNLFGGFEKYYRFQSLKNLGRAGDLQARTAVENTVIQLVNTYGEVARLAENARAFGLAAGASLDRYVRVQARYEFGAVTRLEVLQAKVDLNADSINLVEAQKNLLNAKRDLCVQMGIDPQTSYAVETEFTVDRTIALNQILEKARVNNVSLLLARNRSENAALETRIARAGYYPRLDLNASYEYFRSENEASFIQSQRSIGPAAGVSLSYPIFDGRRQATRVQNADIALESRRESLEQARIALERNVKNTYETYEQNLYLLRLAEDDLETAQLNFERSREAYQTGQLNSTELRQAQLNLVQTINRIAALRIQAKLSELELYRLAGLLIQEVKKNP